MLYSIFQGCFGIHNNCITKSSFIIVVSNQNNNKKATVARSIKLPIFVPCALNLTQRRLCNHFNSKRFFDPFVPRCLSRASCLDAVRHEVILLPQKSCGMPSRQPL